MGEWDRGQRVVHNEIQFILDLCKSCPRVQQRANSSSECVYSVVSRNRPKSRASSSTNCTATEFLHGRVDPESRFGVYVCGLNEPLKRRRQVGGAGVSNFFVHSSAALDYTQKTRIDCITPRHSLYKL